MADKYSTVIESGEGYYLEHMVYIAGEFCPSQQVQVVFSDSDFIRVSIQVFPHIILSDFGEDDKVPFVVAYLDRHAYGKPTWCVLVDGHITGVSEMNQAGARHLTLQGVSDFVSLEDFKLHFFSVLGSGASGLNSYFTDMVIQSYKLAGQKVDTVGQMPSHLLKKGLLGDEEIDSPFGLLKNCLHFVEKSGSEDLNFKDLSAAGKFAHEFMLRTRLYHRCFALDFDKESNLLKSIYKRLTQFADFGATGAFSEIARPILDRVLTEGSIYQWLKSIYDMFMYELVTIPAPSYVEEWDEKIRFQSETLSDSSMLLQFLSKPETINVVPPLCNLITKAAWSSYNVTTNYRDQITRLYLSDGYAVNVSKVAPSVGLTSAVYQETLSAYPSKIQENLKNKNRDKRLLLDTEKYKGIVSVSREIPSWLSQLEGVNRRTMSGTKNEEEEVTAPGKRSDADSYDASKKAAKSVIKNPNEGDLEAKLKKVDNFSSNPKYQDYNEYFAQYIFNDIRSQASNGTIQTIFNPYVIPSFPVLLFAEDPLGIHIYARLVGGTHTLGPNSSTTLNLANKRTLGEIIKKGSTGAVTADSVASSADYNPREAFTFVAETLQNHNTADEYYRKWFYPGRNSLKPSIANYNNLIDKDEYLKGVNGNLLDETSFKWKKDAKTNKTPTYIYDSNDYLEYIARPVVTIAEYMSFMGKNYDDQNKIFRAGSVTITTLYTYEGSGNWGDKIRKYKKKIGFENVDPDLVKVGRI